MNRKSASSSCAIAKEIPADSPKKDSTSDASSQHETDDSIGDDATLPPSSYPHWHTVVAGGTAGFASRMVTAPLDLIRIRRQLTVTYPSESLWASWRKIVQTEGGIPALYRGNMAAIYLWIGYAAVQFSVYNSTKDVLRSYPLLSSNSPSSASDTSNSVLVSFFSGAIAGICATLATYPFDVCRTTFSARGLIPNHASSNAATEIPHPIRPIPRPHLHLSSLYEPPLFPSASQSTMASVDAAVSSIQSSATIAASAKPIHPTFPIPASSLAASSIPSSHATPVPRTFWEFVTHMYRLQGWRGFYAGAAPAILQIIPYMGLNFAIYDYLISYDPKKHQDTTTTKTSVGLSAYAGSISGACSKMVVYPLDTVKRRLQAQAFFAHAPIAPHERARRHYRGTWDCVATIYQTEGWMAFYRGIVPSVAKTAIATSLTFSCFHWTQNTLAWIHDRRYS
jgi:Mitochondrial carrier protein